MAHVHLTAPQPLRAEYRLTTYRDGKHLDRHTLSFEPNPSRYPSTGKGQAAQTSYFARASLSSIPSEVVLETQCQGRHVELVRQAVTWPQIEADAIALPGRRINPIDLGTVLPPHDWLLLAQGQTALVEAVALSHARDLPNAKLRAWFDRGKPTEVALPLSGRQPSNGKLTLSLSPQSDRSILHVRLVDGERELWRKEIRTMVVTDAPRWPTFGAVETKLRYDAPIVTVDPKTGAELPPLDYRNAWDFQLKDIVVFLPNGSRFVFWRGANYVPFWASQYNTGVLYQWAENCSLLVTHPDGSRDCPEPLFDSELRFSRVRIMESSASRVHVQWDYQLTDVGYEVWGGAAREDFFFYPDGFGTRVVTVPAPSGMKYQLSEFIIVTPQATYPLEVLPRRMIEAINLDGGKEVANFPFEPSRPKKMFKPHGRPVVYRVFSHKDDPASAIYFHPSDATAGPAAFPPFFDKGEQVTPVYWGNHWPLNRGKWTGWKINDQISLAPAHNSVAEFTPPTDPATGKWLDRFEVKPFASEEVVMPNAQGQVSAVSLSRFAWLIGYTDLPDEVLREWGGSFANVPAVEITGARLSLPSYSQERRALRLVAESKSIQIKVKPDTYALNPVFELDGAPKRLTCVNIDGIPLPADAYAWDGATLWTKARIDPRGATIRLNFR